MQITRSVDARIYNDGTLQEGNTSRIVEIWPACREDGLKNDWLKDRWQAAKNMQGAPIPGAHWLLVDLEATCVVERIDVEFESAFARDYTLKGRSKSGAWVSLAVGASAVGSCCRSRKLAALVTAAT